MSKNLSRSFSFKFIIFESSFLADELNSGFKLITSIVPPYWQTTINKFNKIKQKNVKLHLPDHRILTGNVKKIQSSCLHVFEYGHQSCCYFILLESMLNIVDNDDNLNILIFSQDWLRGHPKIIPIAFIQIRKYIFWIFLAKCRFALLGCSFDEVIISTTVIQQWWNELDGLSFLQFGSHFWSGLCTSPSDQEFWPHQPLLWLFWR